MSECASCAACHDPQRWLIEYRSLGRFFGHSWSAIARDLTIPRYVIYAHKEHLGDVNFDPGGDPAAMGFKQCIRALYLQHAYYCLHSHHDLLSASDFSLADAITVYTNAGVKSLGTGLEISNAIMDELESRGKGYVVHIWYHRHLMFLLQIFAEALVNSSHIIDDRRWERARTIFIDMYIKYINLHDHVDVHNIVNIILRDFAYIDEVYSYSPYIHINPMLPKLMMLSPWEHGRHTS
jgi:hypothetical protein